MTSIIGPIIVNNVTKDRTYGAVQKATVEMLSAQLDYIDASDELDAAIDKIIKMEKEAATQSKAYENALHEKDAEIEKLKSNMNDMPNVELNSLDVVKNGLKSEETLKNGWAVIEGKNYYSESTVNSLLQSTVQLDGDNKTLYYSENGASNTEITRVALEDTNVLHDGDALTIIDRNNADPFSMGSGTYYSGFILYSDYVNTGSALFDLGGHYSKICFDAGRINNTKIEDVTLRVFLRNNVNDTMKFYKEYELSADTALDHIEIELGYACDMKIEMESKNSNNAYYGFTNIILEY